MAGFYPDVPGNRFAYHADGTQMYLKDSLNNLTQLSTDDLSKLNDEDNDSAATGDVDAKTLIVIFPEMRNFTGYYIDCDSSAGALKTSTDTTNGLDGNWTTVAANFNIRAPSDPVPDYRTSATAVAGGVVKAISFSFGDPSFSSVINVLHLYGTVPLTENPDRLIFWEPVNDNATSGTYFDWGDLAQGTVSTKQFRIKNNSSTKTASSITLSSTAVTFAMTVELSTDGTNYASTINIGDLAPGTISSVLYVRRTVPAAEPLRPQALYLQASATTWV